ncbi:LOW QUALITY PROTEIN: hypothetical protein BT93_K1312 [Corymbia citriodora subsp. variegata]|nr:LOW QUALITY PROTEIN: hypothetical protein BT93_K1312 [Corymbia citriodora subsp. variegata]
MGTSVDDDPLPRRRPPLPSRRIRTSGRRTTSSGTTTSPPGSSPSASAATISTRRTASSPPTSTRPAFSLEGSYQLEYKSTIRGLISENRLKNLQGVKVKLWFVWVDIVEVSRQGDDLQFSVGIAGADFPIDNFEECPQCGCGLNCGDRGVGAITRRSHRPFVDSY